MSSTVDVKVYQSKQVRALYSFDGIDDTELSLKKGDIITLSRSPCKEEEQEDNGEWIFGSIEGKSGFFPATYVEDYQPSYEEEKEETATNANSETDLDSADNYAEEFDEDRKVDEDEYEDVKGGDNQIIEKEENTSHTQIIDTNSEENKKVQESQFNENIFFKETEEFENDKTGAHVEYSQGETNPNETNDGQINSNWSEGEYAHAPLPHGWSVHLDEESGYNYYYNSYTGETTWDYPGGDSNVKNEYMEPHIAESTFDVNEKSQEISKKAEGGETHEEEVNPESDEIKENKYDNKINEELYEKVEDVIHPYSDTENVEDKNHGHYDKNLLPTEASETVDGQDRKTNSRNGTNFDISNNNPLLDDLIMKKIEELVEARVKEELERRLPSRAPAATITTEKKSLIPAVTRVIKQNKDRKSNTKPSPRNNNKESVLSGNEDNVNVIASSSKQKSKDLREGTDLEPGKVVLLRTPKKSKFGKDKQRKAIQISPLSHQSSASNSPKSIYKREKEVPGGVPHIGPPLSSILAENAKQEHNSILYKECRSAVYPPSGWEEDQHQDLRNAPNYRLKLDFIQGYAGDVSKNYSTNIVWLLSGEVAFPAANMVVIMSIDRFTQRFINGHDEEVTTLIRHPSQDVVISGQSGKPAKLLISDTTNLQPEIIGTLIPTADGKTIASLDFSADGELLLCLVEESAEYSLTIWDWRSQKRLCSMNTKANKIHDVKFCPYAYIPKDRVSPICINKNGQEEYSKSEYPYYTLVSAGAKQLKLWVVSPKNVDISGPNTYGMEKIPGIHSGKADREKERGGRDSKTWGNRINANHREDPFQDQWKLEGQLCSLKRTEESIGDSICIAFIKIPNKSAAEPDSDDQLSNVFMVVGTDKGNIVIWQVVDNTKPLSPEQERKLKIKIKRSGGLVPTNNGPIRLRAIQSIEAHDGVVTDILYAGGTMIATCGKDGLVSFWEFKSGNRKSEDLLRLIRSVQLLGSIPGLGAPRSISYSYMKDAWIVGSTGCALCVLRPAIPMKTNESNFDQNTLSISTPPTSPGNYRAKKGNNPSVSNLQIIPLIRGHNATIRTIAYHPFLSVYATSGSDRTLRVWDADSHELLYITRVWDRVASLAFHPLGNTIAVGTEEGEVIVLEIHRDGKNLKKRSTTLTVSDMKDWKIKGRKTLPKSIDAHGSSNKITLAPLKGGDSKKTTEIKDEGEEHHATKKGSRRRNQKEKVTREKLKVDNQRSDQDDGLLEDIPANSHHSGYKGLKSLLEIQVLKYSPDGNILAVASRDKMIHLYETNTYKRHGTCRGHSTAVIRMDFSADSTVLITNDTAREVLFWDVEAAKQMRSPSTTRDMQWDTWTCLYGWPVQGIWTHEPDREPERGLPSVCRSLLKENNEGTRKSNSSGSSILDNSIETNENDNILVVADTKRLRLFKYPCLKGAVCKSTIAHASHITHVGFLHNDSHLISAGGTDNCVFQWNLIFD